MTWVQLLVWRQWLEDQKNEPNRTDHYIMQNTATIVAINSTKASRSVNLKDYRIPFTKPPRPKTEEEVLAEYEAARAARMGAFGGSANITIIHADGTVSGPNYKDRPVGGVRDIPVIIPQETTSQDGEE